MNTYKPSRCANQSFNIEVEDTRLYFHVREFRGVMYCSISDIDGNAICNSVRCLNNGWLIPSAYKFDAGNFRFEDTNNAYPYYQNFGISCFLRYYTKEEIAEM